MLPSIFVHAQNLTGVVVDRNGASVAGASVRLFDQNVEQARTQTDQEGRFSIEGRITNIGRLVVKAAGFAPFERRLLNNGVFDFTIVLQPAAVTGNVTVTITRTETRLGETPASVAVIGRDEIEASAGQAIDDTLRQVAGFTLFRRSSSKTANPTTHGANLRGVSGSGASRAGVLFEGLSLNDAFGGWTYWSRVPLVAVEQAEVLRGGASSLYGSGGLSGAVNLIPVRSFDDELFLRFQTSAGTRSTFDSSLHATFSRRQWSFNVGAEAFKTDGYIPVVEDERGAVDARANSKHGNVIAGLERRFGGSPQRHRGTEDLFSGRMFVRANLFSEDRENGTSLTNNATYFRLASTGGDVESRRIGRFELRTYLQAQVYDQTFSAVSADRNTETLTRLQRVPSQAAGGNLVWTRPFGNHTVVSSIEFRDVRGFSDEVGFSGGVATTESRAGGSERTSSFYAQDLWRMSDRVTISLGARYDRWRNIDALSTTRNLSTNVITVTNFPDRTESEFSPRVAALVSVNDCLSFYGSASRSFRAPTLNELYRGFRVGNVVTQANENLRAETANTLEAGASFRSDSFSLRGNIFDTTVADPIVSISLSSTPTLITRQRQNVGETRSRGLEIDAEFAPNSKLSISASYLFVDARITKFPNDISLIGNRMPQVARQQLTFQLRYRPNTKWVFGVQTRTSSGQFEDDLNTLPLRSYVTFDATAAYKFSDRASAFVAAENIFNSRYDIGLTPNRTVASPASFRAGLRFNFGKR